MWIISIGSRSHLYHFITNFNGKICMRRISIRICSYKNIIFENDFTISLRFRENTLYKKDKDESKLQYIYTLMSYCDFISIFQCR